MIMLTLWWLTAEACGAAAGFLFWAEWPVQLIAAVNELDAWIPEPTATCKAKHVDATRAAVESQRKQTSAGRLTLPSACQQHRHVRWAQFAVPCTRADETHQHCTNLQYDTQVQNPQCFAAIKLWGANLARWPAQLTSSHDMEVDVVHRLACRATQHRTAQHSTA